MIIGKLLIIIVVSWLLLLFKVIDGFRLWALSSRGGSSGCIRCLFTLNGCLGLSLNNREWVLSCCHKSSLGWNRLGFLCHSSRWSSHYRSHSWCLSNSSSNLCLYWLRYLSNWHRSCLCLHKDISLWYLLWNNHYLLLLRNLLLLIHLSKILHLLWSQVQTLKLLED